MTTKLMLATACALVVAMSARTPARQGRPAFRAETTTVSVNVSVRDGNRPVAGLTGDDFQLSDSGIVQHIHDVSVESVPIDVTLIVDTSNSARAEFERFRKDTKQIAGLLRDQDRLRLMTIDTYVHELLPMKASREVTIPHSIGAGGMTSAYDAMAVALMTRVGLDRRHLIVAMTDGWDTMSVLDAETLREVAGRSDAVLHMVLTNETSGAYNPFPSRSLYHDRDLNALRDATSRTGGDLHGAGFFAAADAVVIFRKVFEDFRASYVLHYSPTGVDRNGWHPLKVSVPKSPKYSVRSRQGYFGG
jgi:VWFA-related protein